MPPARYDGQNAPHRPEAAARKPRKGKVLAVLTTLATLAAGIAIGTAASNQSALIAAQRAQMTAGHGVVPAG